MINWKIRLMNKQFWLSLIPALALCAQAVAAVFGWEIDLTTAVGRLLTVVNTVFALLVVLGVVVDPTTAGIGDSDRALGYDEPWEDEEEEQPKDNFIKTKQSRLRKNRRRLCCVFGHWRRNSRMAQNDNNIKSCIIT